MTRIFICHSHLDKEIADKLFNFLMSAFVSLKDNDILRTSDPNSGLSFDSNSISNQLKTNLKEAEVLIALVTTDSLRSPWIPFEIGSFWPTEKPIVLILGPNLDPKKLPGPLRGWLHIHIEKDEAFAQLNKVINQLEKKLGIRQNANNSNKDYHLNQFITQFKNWKPKLPELDISQQQQIEELTKKLEKSELSNIALRKIWNNTLVRYSLFFILCISASGALFFGIKSIILSSSLSKLCRLESQLLSCGEKTSIDFFTNGQQSYEEKEGRKKLAQAKTYEDYEDAVRKLEIAWANAKDPSVLIALNNAKILRDMKKDKEPLKQSQVHTIAVVVPHSNTPNFLSRLMLSGVAWKQYKFNNHRDSYWKLFIVMADDKNDGKTGIEIANKLGKIKNILGVIGPYSSSSATHVINPYRKHSLSLISPTSTASLEDLHQLFIEYVRTQENDELDTSFFFRTTGTSKIETENAG